MVLFATLLAHLLILFLVVAVPIRGARRYRVLMRRIAHHPELRVRFYIMGMLGQWLMLLPLVVIALGLNWPADMLGLQAPEKLWIFLPISLVVLVAVYAQVLYIGRMARTSQGRDLLRQSMSGPLHMLPRTRQERALWFLLSLTAGFCEELLYRGFLPTYLVHIFPGVWFSVAIVIAAALFGLGHIYQKLTGVLGTGVMGLLFGFLYFFTNSLYLSMVLHALFDIRLLFVDVPRIVDVPEQPGEEVPALHPS